MAEIVAVSASVELAVPVMVGRPPVGVALAALKVDVVEGDVTGSGGSRRRCSRLLRSTLGMRSLEVRLRRMMVVKTWLPKSLLW